MAEPLKDLVDDRMVEQLADRVVAVDPDFDAGSFRAELSAVLPELELKDRISAISAALRTRLPDDYGAAVGILVEVAESDLDGFGAWPLCTVVEHYGLDDPTESLAAMEHLTQAWSCEFAIRPFLDRHLDETVAQLEGWAGHDEAAVRRLVSEGTRPLLPWGQNVTALTDDPEIGLGLIEQLRHDPSEDVRRSVANHLNDVAKTRPELVVATASRWLGEDPPVDERLVRHALRSLVKSGDPSALGVLGYTTDARVVVESFEVASPHLDIGGHLELAATLVSDSSEDQRLVVDYRVHHPTGSGATSIKVFKWATVDLVGGATARLSKRRQLAQASTRTYISGWHQVDLQVAGVVVASTGFDLTVD